MTKIGDAPQKDAVGAGAQEDIAKELLDLRADFAALIASLQRYGALGAEELKSRAKDVVDESLSESLKAVHDMRRQIDALQRHLQGDVRAHPLAWLVGALGLGMLIGLLFAHRD